MTVKNTIPATPANRKQWRSNQCATVGCGKSNQLQVTSRQNRSTPGIYTEVMLKQNTCYCVSVCGQALGNAKPFVFVYNPSTKQRLIPNYTFLPSQCTGCVDVQFTTPPCAGEHLCIWLGVLFTSTCNGQQFCLQSICVSAQMTHSPPHAECPLGSSTAACSPRRHYEESVYSDDSGDVETHHHHHYGSDPYYTYDTHGAPCGPASKIHHPCYPPAEKPCTTAVPPTKTQQPVCIADLQSSLSSMISKLK